MTKRYTALFLFSLASLAAAQTQQATSKPSLQVEAPAATVSLHEAVIFPVVRVLCGQGGGSGTVIYCDNKDSKDRWDSFVLTNHHVVDAAIKVEKKWSSLLNVYVDTEVRETVKVEVFKYEKTSRMVGRESFDGDIVAHSKDHDLALLKLRCSRKLEHVAKLRPKALSDVAFLFDPVYAVGCTHLHSPVATRGEVTSLNDEIEGKQFWMGSAAISFGNSGGAVFRQDTLEFIGVPSRVAVTSFGSVTTHMGYWIPISRIYQWAEEERLSFLYSDKTPDACLKEREAMQRNAQFQRVNKDAPASVKPSN